MNRFYAVTDRIAAFSLMAFLALPDLMATTKVLAQRPWEASADIPHLSASAPSREVPEASRPSGVLAEMTVTLGDQHTAYLNSHPGDALNKPADDVFRFELSAEPTQNVAVSFRASTGAVGVTLNGTHYMTSQGGQVVLSKEYVRKGSNTLLFSAMGNEPVSISGIEVAVSSGAATPDRVLERASSADFAVLEVASGYSYALERSQTAAIPVSLSNVTRGATAYRNANAANAVRVRIGVTRTLGVSKLREAKVMYFDYGQKSWLEAPVRNVDHAAYTIEAEVPGGTDYFAALIKTPEMPEASAFMPTAISDLEPKSPAEGITLIQPPTANQQGDANISYPLTIPQGRQGMTPQLALNYSSSGAESWCGYGWSIPVQSISVDTRWGVPTFDDSLQSEVYLLDGESLHEEGGKKANRPEVSGSTVTYPTRSSGARQFFPKQQSSYRKVVRYGTATNNYYWVVTEADGTSNYYGCMDPTALNSNGVLTTAHGDITRWYLKKTEDRFGNNIVYTYETVVHPAGTGLKEAGKTMYLKTIEYTGKGSILGKYRIEFITDGGRQDARINYTSGVKEVDDRILNKIEVYYQGELVKDYRLNPATGDFGKRLLASVGEYHNGQLFYKHTFTYQSAGTTIFESTPKKIKYSMIPSAPSMFTEMPFYSLINQAQVAISPSHIKTTKTTGWSAGGSVGFGFVPKPEIKPNSKEWTLSGKLSYSEAYSHDRYTLQDVNGDGLADLLIANDINTNYSYRPLIIENGTPRFGAKENIASDRLYSSVSRSINTGADYLTAKEIFSAGVNWNYTTSKVRRYLLDYNGDGFLDRVVPKGGAFQVEFGTLQSGGSYQFESNSMNTLNPVLQKEALVTVEEDSLKNFEVVKIWTAPVSGNVQISSDPKFSLGVTGQATVSIQYEEQFIQYPTNIPTNSGTYASTLSVAKGEQLIFRLAPDGTGDQDLIEWNPEVSYTSALPADGNNSNYTTSSYQNSYVLSGGEGVSFNKTDLIKVDLNRDGFGFSDDVYFNIWVDETDTTGSNSTTTSLLFTNRLGQSATGFSSFSAPFIGSFSTVPGLASNREHRLRFEVMAHSNIDWTKTSWRPSVEIQTDCGANPIKFYPNVRYGMYNSVHQLDGPTSLSLPTGSYDISPDVVENKANIDAVFNNLTGVSLDQNVYFVIKSGGKTISKKVLVLHKDQAGTSSNSLKLYTLDQATGTPLNQVTPTQYTGAATAVFSASQITNGSITIEYFAEESPFALEAIKYVKAKLGQTRVITSAGAIHSSWSSGANKNMFYGKTDLLNTRWLGWGQFAWSGDIQSEILKSDMAVGGASVFGTNTAARESLTQSQIGQANPWGKPFFVMMPVRGENAQGLWSYEKALFNTEAKKDHYSVFGNHLGFYRDSAAAVTGLFGEEEQELSLGNASSSVYAAAAASQVTRSSSFSANAGLSQGDRGKSMSTSLLPNDFYSNSTRMFQDFNGDGYPDLVQQNGQNVTMQLTNPTGGHTSSFVAVANERNSKSHSNGGGVMVNGNFKNEDLRFITKGSTTFGVNVGTTYQTIEYEDVNGDGLLDRVFSNQDMVALNNGRGFDVKRSLNIPILSVNQSTVAPPSLSSALSNSLQGMSKRISNKNESFTAGIGVNTSGSRSKSTSIDVNGDGLNDILVDNYFNDSLFVNTGTGYQLWSGPSGQIGVTLATSPNQSQNFGLTADVAATFGIKSTPFDKFSINVNGGANFAVNKTRSSFADFNGDGAVDLVTSDENGDLLIYYSKLVKSNFLTKVENPLGGSFEITYELVGHQRGSYPAKVKTHRANERLIWDMPTGKWVMSSVTVHDGLNIFSDTDPDIDGTDQTKVFFAYDGGIQNRREKEFAGFTRVETRQQNQLGGETSYPKAYVTEVVEYMAPLQLDFQSLKRHSYQKGLVQATYSLYHQEASATSRVTKLISLQNSTYAFRVVDISSANKGTVTPSGSSWANVNWSTIGESQTIFPAVVATEAINYPQVADNKYHSQRFELEYDAYFNVVRYQDKAEMTPGGITEVVVDAVASVTTLEHTQVNSCLNLPTAFFDDGVVKGYAIASTKLGYSNDTLWLTTAPLGTCPSPNEFNVDICAVLDTDTYYTQHYKDTVVTNTTFRTVTTATYTSDRIAVMEYLSPANAAGRTNVLQNHRIYLGAISPTTLVRESNVVSLTADKKSVEKMQTRLDAAGNYAQTDLEYDAYGNVTKLTGPANHLNQRAFTSYTYDNTLSQFVESMSNQFGESACSKYDPLTGLLLQSVDINGQPTAFEYDQFRRIKNVWAPKELRNPTSAPTISYSYTLHSTGSGTPTHAVAITTHNLATALAGTSPSTYFTPNSCALISLAGRPIITTGVRTATIVDGLARAAQVHKEQSNGSSMSHFIVSGTQTLDKFGRPTQLYVDRAASGTFGVLNMYSVSSASLLDDLMQRNINYDYLNRPLSSEQWVANSTSQGQWTTTEHEYGWNQDLLGVDHYFEKTSVLSSVGIVGSTPDAVSATFTDSRGRKVGQITYGATTPENIVTQFDYNDIGELISVTDPIGEQTTYTYDLAGRVKTESHPDRGLTTTTYDKASNVIAINTPGTQAFGGSITMVYDYNRLSKKRMPNSFGTDLYDVDYTYGSFNDGRNGAGRITVITQGGNFKSDSYRYDELGQRIEEDVTVDVPVYGLRDFNTKKYFDSFGRILQAVYPDGDQVDYDYNLLGELNTIKSKVAGVSQDIVSAISYNGYGQISQLTYGNGTITDYSYATGNTNKATTLMGSTVNAKEQGASAFAPVLSRDYTYNKQGMVRKMIRNVAGSLLSQFGTATFTDTYAYDRFGRLDGHEQHDGSSSIYTLDMDYNKAGSITFKNGNGSSFMNATALTYGLEYNYDPSRDHQLDHIWDPASGTTTSFKYNTSGSITQIDDPAQAIPQDFFWNEQQQLTGVKNQQGVHHYIYDHQGERLMKSSLINTSVYLNDQVIDNVTNLDPYTVYVNPYYVVTGLLGGDRVSKHYYMNQQRVATDITINYDPNGGVGGGGGEYAPSKGLDDLKEVVQELSHEPLDTSILALPSITDYYPKTATSKSSNSQAEGAGSSGRILFWYHPDYLGNVDLVTEIDGFAHEFFIYNPWGEEMHQWNANTYAFTSPYRFNSKELDPETGLAYYGARYYQNKMGVLLSVDPKADHPNQVDKSPYAYAWNNPVNLTDPDGRCPFCPWLDAVVDVGFILYDISEIGYDYTTKGKVDPISVAAFGADVASIFVPMSVGAGLVVRASAKINRITSGALKTFSVGKKVDNIGTFATKNLLNDHFLKHADEFGGKFRNADEYLKGAQNFFKRESDEIIQYSRNNGDIVRYDTKNNIFGIAGKDGTIRTMFKPDDGFDYFKREIKQDLGEQTLKEFNKILE